MLSQSSFIISGVDPQADPPHFTNV